MSWPSEWPEVAATLQSEDEATALWQSLITLAEDEVLAAHGKYVKEAVAAQGRAQEPKWVLRELVWRAKDNLPKGQEL